MSEAPSFDTTQSEIDILKNKLCMKDHEIYILQGELQRRIQESELTAIAIDRVEKTMAACYDRLLRKLERLTSHSFDQESRKRRRR